jgi:dTDP-4-amino-4,6-dideoxygalactose transaminase
LNNKNIQTVIHYPRPVYDNTYLNKYKSSNDNVDKNCNQILSIPMYPFLTGDEISYIVESINNFKL